MLVLPCVSEPRAVLRIGAMALACACAGAATSGFAEAPQARGVGDSEHVTPVMVTGTAIADYWAATPAEYAVTAASVLDAVGAPSIRRGTVAGSITAELLTMFAGGGGAPQDVVKLRSVGPNASE